jgi:small subunit ribosomal protein S9
VNGKDATSYFGRDILVSMVKAPFVVTNTEGGFDVIAKICGGGKSGQSGALTHGISKSLMIVDQDNRKLLRSVGLVTRDSRVVERKKYGLKKARKGQTYRKR